VFGQRRSGTAEEVLVAVAGAIAGFVCFCLASSAIYIFNDIIDREADRSHPEKRRRLSLPARWASARQRRCRLSARSADRRGVVLDGGFGRVIVGYIVLMALYSLVLKRAMILDCVVISIGFCLRAVAALWQLR